MHFFIRLIFLFIVIFVVFVIKTSDSDVLFLNTEIKLTKNSLKKANGIGLIYLEGDNTIKLYKQTTYNVLNKFNLFQQKEYVLNSFDYSKKIFFLNDYNFCRNSELTLISESSSNIKCISSDNIKNFSINKYISFNKTNEIIFVEQYNKNIDLIILCQNLDGWSCKINDFNYKSSINNEIENIIKCKSETNYSNILKKYYDQLIIPHLDRLIECNFLDTVTKDRILQLKQFKLQRTKSLGI